jgi:predicted enzyme related to lactoylglutathione lyase
VSPGVARRAPVAHLPPDGISYLRIPAPDPQPIAAFYAAAFGWTVNINRPEPSFEDGTGHVICHFIRDLTVAGEGGVRPYVYVNSLDDALEKISRHGGAVVEAPYPEGDLWGGHFP